MSPRLRVMSSALIPALFLVASLAAPVHAQFYDTARRSLDFSLDGIERSPGMLGMGRLSLVGNDPHLGLTLWDFAANPTGILQADTTNTIELYPATSARSEVHDLSGDARTRERQDMAGRETRMGYEFWRRSAGRVAYGFVGDLGQLRSDQVYAASQELRNKLTQPTVMPVMVGRVPYVKSDRWLYSARLFYSGEGSILQYREIVDNGEGQYIDQDGTQIDSPDYFTPTTYSVRSVGGGLGLAYDRGRALKVALALDEVQNTINGSNDHPRHSAQTSERRPVGRAQLTLVGRVGRELEWGVDGLGWRASSEEHWGMSVSAGIGAVPLSGQGKLLEREERGQQLRTRLRWSRGPVMVGAGLSTRYQRTGITPPGAEDLTSFNYFRNLVVYRQNADTLEFPDSVSQSQTRERSWQFGAGMALRLRGGRGLWGVEFHRDRDRFSQADGVDGPLARGWDVRTGLEYRYTNIMTGRLGLQHRWYDRDAYTKLNEYIGNSLTLGLGLRPVGASWAVDVGYAVEWTQADFGSPIAPRGSRQQLAGMLRWAY